MVSKPKVEHFPNGATDLLKKSYNLNWGNWSLNKFRFSLST